MKQGYLKYNLGELYFEVFGAGEPIIFIHGFTLDHRIWQSQVEEFSKTNMVIVYDLRGYGKSSIPINVYSHSEDLNELMEYLDIQTANIVGLSLGGEIAINFTLKFPTRVKSLVLLDTSLSGYKSTVDWNVKAKEAGIDVAKKNWLSHKVFETTNKNLDVKNKLSEIVNGYSGWHWLNRDLDKDLGFEAINKLSEIKIPVSISVGENDLDYFHKIADYIHSQTPGSIKHIIPGAGHMVNMEKPKEVGGIIKSFLSDYTR